LSFAQAWASAWSSGDAQRYLTFYSEQFVPESQSSFQAWADQRKQRVTPEQNIQVRIEEAKVLVRTAEDVDIQFRQLYQSKTLKARSNKSLTLSKQTGQWKIVREQIVSQ
jgi:ketosteroid isomerase-like protein